MNNLLLIIAILGVLLIISGFAIAMSGLTNFSEITLANTATVLRIGGGVATFIVGLVVVKVIDGENNTLLNQH